LSDAWKGVVVHPVTKEEGVSSFVWKEVARMQGNVNFKERYALSAPFAKVVGEETLQGVLLYESAR